MESVPLDRLEQELRRELGSPVLARRFADWSAREPVLARFNRPGELLRFLHGRPPANDSDAVLRALVAEAPFDPAAARLVLHALLPGLKRVARRALVDAREREELWSALLAHAWERIRTYPLQRRPRRIAANLLLDAMHATLATMRRTRARELPLAAIHERAAVSAYGDVDALIGRAVAAGAISAMEAELVLATRFDGIPLAHLATARGEPYNRVKVRRQRAERRLLLWLGYRPVPRGQQKRPSCGARVVGAGSSGQAGERPPNTQEGR